MSISRVFPLLFKSQNGILSQASRSLLTAGQDKQVIVEVNDKTGIAIVSLNRPPVNSLSLEFFKEIAETLDDLEKNKSKGMILTSSLNTVFSAGLHLDEIYKPDPERFKQFWTAFQDAWIKLYGSSFATAAAINGHAPAGGCLISLSCEYRVMCPKYIIGLNETRVSLVAPLWVQATMRNVLTTREAEKALLLGTLYTTDEALKINLIDEIAVDKADAIAKCEIFLKKYGKISADARAQTKKAFRNQTINDLLRNRSQDLESFYKSITQPDLEKEIGNYIAQLRKK